MEFDPPSNSGFTVYSKNGCGKCNKIKTLLTEKNIEFIVIECDEYLKEKESFLLFIKEHAQKEYNLFPMVFNDGLFIGGYNDAKLYIDKLFLSFEDSFI